MTKVPPAIDLSKPAAESVEIAVIGGGPKAAAIAAKRWILKNQGKADVNVTIFEHQHIGAHWSGKGGYTDGEQALCTVAERDAGFPYNATYDRDVHIEMAAEFSWATFLHARPPNYETDYGRWIDAGRKPPLHRDFAHYLQWVIAKTRSRVVKQRVVGLVANQKRWQVTLENKKGIQSTHAQEFDAVVVTGPGPARATSLPKDTKAERERWQQQMDVSLQLKGAPWDTYPPLHAPMLASELGPGFGSLMVLGAMADRVLAPYRPAMPTATAP
jgi:hypothetical protein